MHRLQWFWKIGALVSCGGVFWMLGAGSCLPYNFYSTLLADSVIATFVSTITSVVAGSLAST